MRIPDSLVEELLLDNNRLDQEKLKVLKEQEKTVKKPLQDLVIRNNIISEEELTKIYAQAIDVPFIELNPKTIKLDVLKLLPERIANQYRAIVFDIDENNTKLIAMEDPDDIQSINFLQKQLDNNIRIYITTSSMLENALDQYRGNINNELTKVIASQDNQEDNEEIDTNDLAEDSPIAQTVNLIIEYGIKAGASDIHIEPRENVVVIRYRIDGLLKEANRLPIRLLNAIVSRIKILANLKIDEHRAPQDGRFKVEVNGSMYAIRVSTLPILDGEKIVMRILNESSKAADFVELGFWGNPLIEFNSAITQPHGLILITGPTGSGKSTTLFSVLSSLNTPDVNISTVEDPIEYHIVGVNQTQVNPIAGMTFANGLRALLRQDPNIIMLGEIRDHETADLAVQAALTGHLVFSTLHTNNAATSLPRLLDMGVEPFLIASTVRIVVAQRLVRKLCPNCRSSFIPDDNYIKRINNIFKLQSNYKKIYQLEMSAQKDGIGINKSNPDLSINDISSSPTKIHRFFNNNPEGCDLCNHTGFRGRIGIYEVLTNSNNIQKLIISNSSSEVIESTAIENGMLPMQIDGLIKALRGETTVEEILRVTTTEVVQ
jgi:type IV pilus assembly protein PilB